MSSKRRFGEMDNRVDTARVLMLLSQRRRRRQQHQHGEVVADGGAMPREEGHARVRVFECRTCGRRFPTFQALGGHRASHKRPRTAPARAPPGDDVGAVLRLGGAPLPSSSTEEGREGGGGRTRATHGCPVCGVEFPVGQALGGHLHRHRAAPGDAYYYPEVSHGAAAAAAARVKVDGVADECTGGVCLDLNLTPSENCAKFRHAGLAAAVNSVQTTILLDCSL